MISITKLSVAMASSSKGPNFTPEEDLSLAKAWISGSETTTDLNSEAFWKAVLVNYRTVAPRKDPEPR